MNDPDFWYLVPKKTELNGKFLDIFTLNMLWTMEIFLEVIKTL